MDNREKVKKLLEKYEEVLEGNPLLFGLEYFDHHFRRPSPQFHVKILREALNNLYFAVAAPRGSAKSTVLAFLYPTHCIAMKKKRFIVILSSTEDKSSGTLNTIKAEFKENHKLKEHYKIELEVDGKLDAVFVHPDGFKTRVVCRGRKQMGGIRGIKFIAWRPDLFIVDDLEDDEMVKNPELRQECKDIFDNSVMKAGEENITQFLIIGTILHDDCLMKKFVSPNHYTKFRKLLYKSRFEYKGEKYSIWPELWSVKRLNEMEKDNITSFAQEMQNDPVSGLLQNIKKEDFRRWEKLNDDYILYDEFNKIVSRGTLKNCKSAISCDLAWDEKKRNDESVFMPGFLTPNSELLIYRYVNKKGMKPNEIFEIIFSMENMLRKLTGNSVPIGFEKGKLEKVIKHLFRNEMKKRNKWLIFKDLLWDADKITRIITRLEPRYSQNSIYHLSNMGDLENQLIRIPSGAHDDLADCAQGLVQLLNNPKVIKEKKEEYDPNFNWIRNQVIRKRNNYQKYKIKGRFSIPATEYFR